MTKNQCKKLFFYFIKPEDLDFPESIPAIFSEKIAGYPQYAKFVLWYVLSVMLSLMLTRICG